MESQGDWYKGKRREIGVQAVGKPTKGMFKGELMPDEWLSSVEEIAELVTREQNLFLLGGKLLFMLWRFGNREAKRRGSRAFFANHRS